MLAADAPGILHAHQILNRIHIYDVSGGAQNSRYVSSSVAFAIDAHHLISTYLFVSPTILNSNQHLFVTQPTGLLEVYPQYLDMFNGLTLLYSPNEIKSYLNYANISPIKLTPGDRVKIITPAGDPMDRTESSYTGTINDDIHLVNTLRSAVQPTGTGSNGALVIDNVGRIAGIYQGHYYTNHTESFTPSQSFVYLIEKAIKFPVYKMDINVLRGQLNNQIRSYQSHLISAFESATPLPTESIERFTISQLPDFFHCEKTLSGEPGILCTPRLPIYAFEGDPAVDVRARFQTFTTVNNDELANAVYLESKASREFFRSKKTICGQQSAHFEFASDTQLHFCTANNSLIDKSFDTLIRGVTLNPKKTNLYFEFLIRNMPGSGTTKTSNVLVESIRSAGNP